MDQSDDIWGDVLAASASEESSPSSPTHAFSSTSLFADDDSAPVAPVSAFSFPPAAFAPVVTHQPVPSLLATQSYEETTEEGDPFGESEEKTEISPSLSPADPCSPVREQDEAEDEEMSGVQQTELANADVEDEEFVPVKPPSRRAKSRARSRAVSSTVSGDAAAVSDLPRRTSARNAAVAARKRSREVSDVTELGLPPTVQRPMTREREKIELPPPETVLPPICATQSPLLSRETLLNVSCKNLDAWLEKLKKVRPFTKEEKREVQKQRRLIKNRESAQVSRQRKKGYMDVLEEQIQRLNETNAELQAKNSTLAAENEKLRIEVNRLSSLINKGSAALGNAFRAGSEAIGLGVASSNDGAARSSKRARVGFGGSRHATTSLLMIMLVSIGLFMGGPAPGEPAKSSLSSYTRESVPQVMPMHTSRALLAADQYDSDPIGLDEEEQNDSVGGAGFEQFLHYFPAATEQERKSFSSSSALQRKRDAFSDDSREVERRASPRRTSIVLNGVRDSADNDEQSRIDVRALNGAEEANVTALWLLPEVHELSRDLSAYKSGFSGGRDAPFKLGLVLPSGAITHNSTASSDDSTSRSTQTQHPALQVTCEVTAVARYSQNNANGIKVV